MAFKPEVSYLSNAYEVFPPLKIFSKEVFNCVFCMLSMNKHNLAIKLMNIFMQFPSLYNCVLIAFNK